MNLLCDVGAINLHGHVDMLYESPNILTLKPEVTSRLYVKQPDNTNKSNLTQLIASTGLANPFSSLKSVLLKVLCVIFFG